MGAANRRQLRVRLCGSVFCICLLFKKSSRGKWSWRFAGEAGSRDSEGWLRAGVDKSLIMKKTGYAERWEATALLFAT